MASHLFEKIFHQEAITVVMVRHICTVAMLLCKYRLLCMLAVIVLL